MAERERRGRQLAIELPPELLHRLKAHAAAADRPVSAVVRRWIEAGLDGGLAAGADDGPELADLVQRVVVIEQQLATLQRQASPDRAQKATRSGEARPAPAPLDLASVPAGGIETAALAELLGMRRGTLNAQIARAGGARDGLELHGWRCAGLVRPERGGPPRALWLPAA